MVSDGCEVVFGRTRFGTTRFRGVGFPRCTKLLLDVGFVTTRSSGRGVLGVFPMVNVLSSFHSKRVPRQSASAPFVLRFFSFVSAQRSVVAVMTAPSLIFVFAVRDRDVVLFLSRSQLFFGELYSSRITQHVRTSCSGAPQSCSFTVAVLASNVQSRPPCKAARSSSVASPLGCTHIT